MLTGAPFMTDDRRMDASDGYNYVYFDRHVEAGADDADEAAFRASFGAGEPAGDFPLVRLEDGAQVRLSQLWRSKPLVMEFGSFT
jgi:hypothetical protein